jgi:hypothetical protein
LPGPCSRKVSCCLSPPYDCVSRATISSTAASARASISCLVWSCMGCGTYTASKSGRLSAAAWVRAAVWNSPVATGTAGTPKFSKFIVSCKLHVVHDPQSASASTTASTARSCSIMPGGAGFEYVGFVVRTTFCHVKSLAKQVLQSIEEEVAAGLADIQQTDDLALQTSRPCGRRRDPYRRFVHRINQFSRHFHSFLETCLCAGERILVEAVFPLCTPDIPIAQSQIG